ncbi:hypothetical protein ACEQ8H_000527 [Pleosporales sp. CAS-2024a]
MPSVVALEEQPALRDALESLHRSSRIPAKQRSVQVADVVHIVCQHAWEHGLDEDALRTVVQLVCVKTHLDQSTVTTLVKNLYPAQRVPAHLVVTIVGALGQGKGKPSPGTQDSLVKWLRNVNDILEDPSVLSRLYGVLFGMLDMISISLELSRGIGNEPALQGLLRVFKDYYPEIILGSTSTSPKSFAPQPSTEWQTRILAIQHASTAADEALHNRHNGFKVSRRPPGKSELSAIPDVHTYHATETSVTLEGIDNVEDFVERLDRIEPPGQMIAFLTDPLLQKYIDLRPSIITAARIHLWISACLEDLYESERFGTTDPRYRAELLHGLFKHAENKGELHPVVVNFLQAYLSIWKGHHDQDVILGLLVYVPITSFQEAQTNYFTAIEQVLSSYGALGYEKLIRFYTALLQQQVCAATSRYSELFESDSNLFHDLTAHVSTLSTSLLLSLQGAESPTITSSILSFYELLSKSSIPHIMPIILPPVHLVCFLTQVAGVTTFSRICGILAALKIAFDKHPKPVRIYYPSHVTDTLNWCLRDIYQLVWLARALVAADNKALGLYCDPTLRSTLNTYLDGIDSEYSIGTAFSFSNFPGLASMSAAAWSSMEQSDITNKGYDKSSIQYHKGPVSQRSLEVLRKQGGVDVAWDGQHGYKAYVMKWLEERGLGGIRELMLAIVTELRSKA